MGAVLSTEVAKKMPLFLEFHGKGIGRTYVGV